MAARPGPFIPESKLHEERLLERIRRLETDPERRSVSDPLIAVNSVLDHLRKILNTRQGNVQIADDYGVPDFTDLVDLRGLDSIRNIEETLSGVIAKYEPRLTGVRIKFAEDSADVLSMDFRMEATLDLEEQRMSLVLETVLQPDGRITVREQS